MTLRDIKDVGMTINPDGSIDMRFISSNIHLKAGYGAKIIAPSCGDGKTTMIKYIMKHYFNYGILVAVDTIEEVKRYGEFIKKEIVGTTMNGFTFTEDDYILLYSGNENKKFEYTYSSNPNDIMDKHIVVCTHHKLFNNDICILMYLNLNIRNPLVHPVFSNKLTKVQSAMGYSYANDGINRRQFVLIDELPRCEMLTKRITKPLMSLISDYRVIDNNVYGDGMVIDPRTGMLVPGKVVIEPHEPDVEITLPDRDSMIWKYNNLVRGTQLDLYQNNREIDNINLISTLDTFYSNFYGYMAGCRTNPNGTFKELPEYIDVSYNLASLASPFMMTNLWLFDGTGDLSFCGVQNFDMCVPIANKFQSSILFNKIDISSGRRFKESTLYSNPDKVIGILTENINTLLNVFRKSPNSKILIVTWKNLRFHNCDPADMKVYNLGKYLSKEGKIIYLDLAGYYKDSLDSVIENMKSTGEIGPDFEYSIIHYQSGLDRATNEFRNYDSIVFLGEFVVPRSAIEEHNLNMGCNTDLARYTIQQIVQAICRTRIRNHKGEPIVVYYTSDWDERYMILANLYMSPNVPPAIKLSFITHPEDLLMSKEFIESARLYFNGFSSSLESIRPKWRKVVRILCGYDRNLEYHILNKIPYTLNISLDNLYELIPMSRKDKDKYRNFHKVLNSFGVTFNIT